MLILIISYFRILFRSVVNRNMPQVSMRSFLSISYRHNRGSTLNRTDCFLCSFLFIMFYHALFFFLLLFFNSLKRFNLSKRAKSSRYFILRTTVFFLGLFSFYEYLRKNYREITVQVITRSHVFISRAELRASTYKRPFHGFFFFDMVN